MYPKWQSFFIPKNQKYNDAAAFSDYKRNHHGEVECLGRFLGVLSSGCHNLDHSFDIRAQCLKPLDPADWKERKSNEKDCSPRKQGPDPDAEPTVSSLSSAILAVHCRCKC